VDQVTLSVPSYIGSSVTYDWTLPSGVNVSGINTNAITISPVDLALHEGDYSVEITVDGCVITSDIFNLELHATPKYRRMHGMDRMVLVRQQRIQYLII